MTKENAFPVRVGGINVLERAGFDYVAERAGGGGVGGSEKAAADLAACLESVFELCSVSAVWLSPGTQVWRKNQVM